MRTWQIQVFRRAFAQVVVDLAAIDLGDFAGRRDDRDDDRAVKMLVSRFAPQPDLLQATPDVAPRLAALLREPEAQRPVSKADLEALDHLPIVEATLGEIRQGLGCLFQALVVVAHRLGEKRLVGGIETHRRC